MPVHLRMDQLNIVCKAVLSKLQLVLWTEHRLASGKDFTQRVLHIRQHRGLMPVSTDDPDPAAIPRQVSNRPEMLAAAAVMTPVQPNLLTYVRNPRCLRHIMTLHMSHMSQCQAGQGYLKFQIHCRTCHRGQ